MEISHANFWALAQPSDESMHLIKDGAMIVKYEIDKRGLVRMKACFCFLELQDHWLLVQLLYILILFCTAY